MIFLRLLADGLGGTMRNKIFNLYLATFSLQQRLKAFKYWKKDKKKLTFFGFLVEYRNQFLA